MSLFGAPLCCAPRRCFLFCDSSSRLSSVEWTSVRALLTPPTAPHPSPSHQKRSPTQNLRVSLSVLCDECVSVFFFCSKVKNTVEHRPHITKRRHSQRKYEKYMKPFLPPHFPLTQDSFATPIVPERAKCVCVCLCAFGLALALLCQITTTTTTERPSTEYTPTYVRVWGSGFVCCPAQKQCERERASAKCRRF